MNLDDLLNEMSEKMRNRDLSDEYLREHNNSTREEIGIGEYAYGITMIPCEWVYEYLSDYKRVLEINEVLLKENEALKNDYENLNNSVVVKNHCIKNSIPVQKVKDEIDRIDYDIKKTKEIISDNSNIYTSDRRNDYQIVRLRAMNTKSLDIKKRLQELIEEKASMHDGFCD